MQTYGTAYHTYPIFSEETSFEGAFKRYTTMPTPQEVYDYALMGIPKIFPLTHEPIPVSIAQDALQSAVVEIEMELGMDISPVVRYHSEDYIDGMFTQNYMGVRLQHFPATKIIMMQMKLPHAQSTAPYQTYTIPSNWIALRKNRVNVMASMGSTTTQANNPGGASANGVFIYTTGFTRGAYHPNIIETVYQSGWDHDKLPSNIADLIKTWAAYRMLPDLVPIIAPNTSVSVSMDSVNQSASNNLAQLLSGRIELLQKKKDELAASVNKNFGRTIKMTTIGS